MPHMQYAFMRANYPVLLALETQLRITIMNMDDQQRVLRRYARMTRVWSGTQIRTIQRLKGKLPR